MSLLTMSPTTVDDRAIADLEQSFATPAFEPKLLNDSAIEA